MGQIRVDPAVLRGVAGAARSIGTAIRDAAPNAHGALDEASTAAPPHTADALEHLSRSWRVGLSALADDVHGLGQSLDAAATLYEKADRDAISAGGVGGWG
jgi:uncharacterized protein YukE